MRLMDVDHLSVGYLDARKELVPAVDDVSFFLDKGECLGIVGESGCGKSTLARALMGYFRPGCRPMGGRVLLEGRDALTADAAALRELRGRRIAMVPQNPLSSLTYHMRVGPQVAEILEIHRGLGAKAARRRTLDLFEATNLPDPERLYRRFPHEISGGQRQRVVIAAALACEPAVMILDEPTTALDTTTEMQVLKLVKDLRDTTDTSIVYITHDLTLTDYMCDRVLVMLDGRIVERGTASEVFESPTEDYTRMLVSAIPRIDTGPPDSKLRLMPTGNPLLEVDELSFTYRVPWSPKSIFAKPRTTPAVDRVSFEVGRGETLGLVGESGSGKSTIANVLVGLNAPGSGRVSFDGHRLDGSEKGRTLEQRRRIQIIFQDPLSSLNPRHRVETILTRPLGMFFGTRRREARDRAVELLAEVDLPAEILNRFPRQLSGGQQQRVAIARAFAAEPELILCDEVTSALDVSVQAQVLDLLARIQSKTGAACVFISHDLGVIQQVAQRCVVLKDGRVVEAGLTGQIFSDPDTDYTRMLLAAAARQEQPIEPTDAKWAGHGGRA